MPPGSLAFKGGAIWQPQGDRGVECPSSPKQISLTLSRARCAVLHRSAINLTVGELRTSFGYRFITVLSAFGHLSRMLQGKVTRLHCTAPAAYASPAAPFKKHSASRLSVRRRAAGPTPQEAAEMQKAMQAAMKDPQVSRCNAERRQHCTGFTVLPSHEVGSSKFWIMYT